MREISWIQSHVVRAPLARILGLAQLIGELKGDPNEQAEMVGYLQSAATELDNVVRQVTEKTSIQEHDKYIKKLNLSDCEHQFFNKLASELNGAYNI